jgi:hypothetical protein
MCVNESGIRDVRVHLDICKIRGNIVVAARRCFLYLVLTYPRTARNLSCKSRALEDLLGVETVTEKREYYSRSIIIDQTYP